MFFSLLGLGRVSRKSRPTSPPADRASSARLQLTQLENRENPSHVIDLPVAAWGPLPGLSAGPALVAPAAPGPATASAAAPTQAQARYEIRFMENMIDHHMMAVRMAQVCEQNATHEELRDLCAQIEASQSQEIAQMQSWLRQWYGITYEPRMTPGMERQIEKLASLGGAEFEIEFMQMMIEHHEKAVREGERCVERAYHPELIQLCQNIVQTQTEEIQTMQTWLSEWYGVEPRGGDPHE